MQDPYLEAPPREGGDSLYLEPWMSNPRCLGGRCKHRHREARLVEARLARREREREKLVDIKNLKNGGYCHVPETAKDWPGCDAGGCKATPAYEFYPTEWFKPTDKDTFWYYICQGHLESIVGQIED